MLFAIAWRNLGRHARRSFITALAMAVGVALCMGSIALSDGIFQQVAHVMVDQALGHVQVHHPDWPTRKRAEDTQPGAAALVAALEGRPGVVGVTGRLVTAVLVGGPSTSAGARVLGVDPRRESAVSGLDRLVASGVPLGAAPGREVLLGVELARSIGVGVGDEVVFVGQGASGSIANDLFRVVGLVRTGSTLADRSGAWVHLADLQAFLELPDQVHEVLILGTDAGESAALRAAVAPVVPPGRLLRTWEEASPVTARLMALQDGGAVLMLGFVFSVAALGVLNTMLMSVFERTRELGVLRAIGMSPGRVMGLVLAEALLLGGLAAGLGLVLGGAVDAYLVHVGIDFSVGEGKGLSWSGIQMDPVIRGAVRWQGVALTLGAVLGVSLLAAVWPAWRAARLRPVDAMRQV